VDNTAEYPLSTMDRTEQYLSFCNLSAETYTCS